MLPQSIIDKILTKYGKEQIFSAGCAPLGNEIGPSETTIKRMFGLVGAESRERNRVPHNSTMDVLAKWLGYDDYKALLSEIGEGNYSSEFTSVKGIEVAKLDDGTQIQLRYDPGRTIATLKPSTRI